MSTRISPSPPRVTVRPFGRLPDGTEVDLYTVTGGPIALHAITYGAIITSLEVPDRDGTIGDVVLGHSHLEPYLSDRSYVGAVVGRYANRIAHGRFVLDDVEHQLARNDGPNHLHGGQRGFDRYNWDAASFAASERAGVTFTRTSPDGEEHYPGTLACSVTYALTARGSVECRYDATTDAPTIVNLSQHTYFNLGGDTSRTTLDHALTIYARDYTPVDRGLIPTGQFASVANTPFDFRQPIVLRNALAGQHEQLTLAGGFDHNFILERPADTLASAATLRDPHSGRVLHISTTEPGLQFDDGHLLDSRRVGAYGRVFGPHAGICLETQHYPDSPNHPHFPPVQLRPSERYHSITRWEFTTE